MLNLGNDIFLIQNILTSDLVNELLSLRKTQYDLDRINLTEDNIKLLYKFDNMWMEHIEPKIMNEYLSVYDIDNNVGMNASIDTINSIKEYCKTRWRDLYTLKYNPENSNNSKNQVHFDFSGITAIGSLDDEFTGGELCFPRQHLEHRLEKGDLIIFPGGLTHPHYVNPITSGIRNVIVGQSLTLSQDHQINY